MLHPDYTAQQGFPLFMGYYLQILFKIEILAVGCSRVLFMSNAISYGLTMVKSRKLCVDVELLAFHRTN
ncbi:unnamed protein product [Calypogeia fissa]